MTATRVALALLVASGLFVGGWAQLSPRGFYANFPGLDRVWLTPLGPFNEHLVRDVGALDLALAALAGWAFVRPWPERVRAVGVVWSVWGILHLAYHLSTLDMFPTLENVLSIGSLTLTAIAAATLVLAPAPAPARRSAA